MSRKKKYHSPSEPGVELNVMPFIDIFSLLCTFLLFSAVFVSIGIHTVQVPFFTNASAEKKDEDSKPERSLDLKLSISKVSTQLSSMWTLEPRDSQVVVYDNNEQGYAKLHTKLIELKKQDTEHRKIEVFIDEDVTYDNISQVLDQVTLKLPGDPDILSEKGPVGGLFNQVIFASVIH